MKIKRRPLFSIIILIDNNTLNLVKCLDVFVKLNSDSWKFEFIVITSYSDEKKTNEIQTILSRFSSFFPNIIFFQSSTKTSDAQSRNLGLSFAKGTWIYFIDNNEVLNFDFVKFLNNARLNLQIDFYRIPIMSENKEKIKPGLLKSRFFSDKASTFIFNSEFIEKTHLKWESYLEYGESLVMLGNTYAIRNVNYSYLRKIYGVIHDFSQEEKKINQIQFVNVLKACEEFIREKKYNYRQNIIVLLKNYFDIINNKKIVINKNKKEIRKILKQAKITIFSFFKLTPGFSFKSILLWFSILF